MDYEQPNEALTGCGYYTWLSPGCYTNAMLTTAHISPQQQLAADMSFIAANHMGNFQRVFISIDELFSCFDSTTGFCGYSNDGLANLDNALSIIAAARQKVDLVLLAQDNAAGFHFEALDGYHSQMEEGYVEAVRQFVQHIAENPTDSSAVSVIDLQNEAYYQIAAHLSRMANVCGADWGCIDHNLARPWLVKLYSAAKAAAPQIMYTVSSTDDLLNSSQAAFLPLYAGITDIYDIHLYSGSPWELTGELAKSANLTKPWFVGEAGCASNGSTACTYDGGNVACEEPAACSLSADTWWLEHLRSYGAFAVLVQNAGTSISLTPSLTLVPSLVGEQIIRANSVYPPSMAARIAALTSRRAARTKHAPSARRRARNRGRRAARRRLCTSGPSRSTRRAPRRGHRARPAGRIGQPTPPRANVAKRRGLRGRSTGAERCQRTR